MSLALRLDKVTFAYGHAPPVLRDVGLQVERGENYLTVMRRNLAALRAALGCR